MSVTTEIAGDPKLRHDPPDLPGYRLERRPAIPVRRLSLLSFPLAIPFGVFFYVIGLLLQPDGEVTISLGFVNLLILAGIVLIVVPVAHEAVHGVIAKLLGARPFYGIGAGFAYTSFEQPVSPRHYRLITIGPIVVLSAFCIALFPVSSDWFLFVLGFAVINAAGAVGDLWILWSIRELPENAVIYDLADGYAAFVPE
jgi:hypothetical protein